MHTTRNHVLNIVENYTFSSWTEAANRCGMRLRTFQDFCRHNGIRPEFISGNFVRFHEERRHENRN